MSGKPQVKSISRALPVSLTVFEVLFLALLGALAVLVRAKLRVPLQLPGHHGLEVMAILLIGRKVSNIPVATSISTLVASILIFFPFTGFNDPFLPLVYFLMGATIDLMYKLIRPFRENILLFALLGGIAYMIIPLSRILIHFSHLHYYQSIARGGYLYPVLTHFLFGTAGATLAAAVIYAGKRLKKPTS